MPYITDGQRARLLEGGASAVTPGQLNYLLTTLCQQYLHRQGTPGYTEFNDVIGALEACKLEFYRRAAAPFEDEKIRENGDVY
jgi:hypothetical protein